MVRSLALAMALGASIAACGAFGLSQREWRNFVAAWLGGGESVTLAMQGWPMCTTMASLGSVEGLDPDFAAGKQALAAGNWEAAIPALKLAALREPDNADIQNYIGYAYHRLRQAGPAMEYYNAALTFNRRHRAAHEHLGELYLALGEPAKAEEHLAALEEICLIPCQEFDDLQRELATYRGSPTH